MQDVASLFRRFVRLDRKRAAGGLTPEELERWTELKRSLGQKFSPGLSDRTADARDSLRVPTSLEVSFRNVGELSKSLMTNLSRGGLFVVTERPAEIGAHLELRIHVEDPDRLIVVPAVVVSRNLGPSFASVQRGMGLRFLDMEADAQRLIDDLYERVLEEATRSVG